MSAVKYYINRLEADAANFNHIYSNITKHAMAWHTINSEHSTSSQEPGEASSQTFCLGTYLLELARSSNTQETFCSQDNETDTCQSSPYGTTCAHLMESPGEEQLTFFAEDSPVRTSVRRVKEQELAESVRDYGRNMRDSLERCGLSLSLPKTHHCFALGDLELCSKTWPRWGIMLDGECSELGMSVRHIKETECGSWPTPTTMDKLPPKSAEALHREATVARPGRSRPANLRDCVHPEQMKQWPTPLSRDWKDSMGTVPPSRIKNAGLDTLGQKVAMDFGTQIQQTYPTPRCFMHKDALTDRGKSNLGEVINEKEKMTKTGQLNPPWVEWLMGWPIGWTDLKPLVTVKFRNVQQWHLIFSQKD